MSILDEVLNKTYNEEDRRVLYKKDKGELIEIIIRLEREKRHLKNKLRLP